MTLDAWRYQDPEKIIMNLQAKRQRLKRESERCQYRQHSIFKNDPEHCQQRQGFERCQHCNLKKEQPHV